MWKFYLLFVDLCRELNCVHYCKPTGSEVQPYECGCPPGEELNYDLRSCQLGNIALSYG